MRSKSQGAGGWRIQKASLLAHRLPMLDGYDASRRASRCKDGPWACLNHGRRSSICILMYIYMQTKLEFGHVQLLVQSAGQILFLPEAHLESEHPKATGTESSQLLAWALHGPKADIRQIGE
ncbi:predicted protein [Uncinocarpus reesii 1704]|uniref:Uncharacterized protein n=1 Tax=Uncinocarpus reesii (strain UAMH 1704) TaxID=336963 RepID=C4JPA9_UNCRE|nr:uncharacterized protein UREG_04491 [Uncinocarpus reesii 1704]EEP79645.1 predicted protein [Uncinocarpus reesii 1704]